MRIRSESFFVKYHLFVSLATFLCGLCIAVICLVPSFIPDIHRLLLDERIRIAVPYLLFFALGGPLFSIWYFLVVNKREKKPDV